MDPFVGREQERKILSEVFHSGRAELIAMYGRRRVGKTFLIEQFFSPLCPFFEITGSKEAHVREQLLNFSRIFSTFFCKGEYVKPPGSWNDAFALLHEAIKKSEVQQRIVLFFDEVPWLSSKKSKFLAAFEYYWNRHFSKDKRIIMILCGSASAWMVKRIVNNRGGLYGRLTRIMRLLPFKLNEAEEFLLAHNVELDRKQLVELYMAVGGIPQYLGMVKRGMSATAAINDLFFQPNAPLYPEFDRVFRSLFDQHQSYVDIIRALASKKSGLTKIELLKAAKLTSGGGSSTMLKELQECGFIAYLPHYGAKKSKGRYVLIDEYCLFYIVWVESVQKITPASLDEDYWFKIQRSQSWKAWAGYAFESICIKHIQQIKRSLGIAGVSTTESEWSWNPPKKSKEKGAQIDLIIERMDRCTNLIEMKFIEGPFTINKAYSEELKYKKNLFREKTGTPHALFTTLLTTQGIQKNMHSLSVVDAEITVDALF
jgi:AAA+ ATPase superfamily predicted ATPase